MTVESQKPFAAMADIQETASQVSPERGARHTASSPDENLSPSRKAILQKFNSIGGESMGSPIGQPDFCRNAFRSSVSSAKGTPGRQSPFKRALINSQRTNVTSRGQSASSVCVWQGDRETLH